tara:strand:+ start:170 stop:550 length:381 start_codon:yes stop_codon:yes gene_type:complete
MKQKEILWARKCDITGQGMNEGYMWGDGQFYCINDDSIALAEFRKEREHIISHIPKNVTDIDLLDNWLEDDDDEYLSAIDRVKENTDTNEDLRSLSYLFDLHYYTNWEDEDEYDYIEINNKLIERW